MALTDQGLGGRATSLTLASSAMTGTWRAKVHIDPKASPIAQTAFLVEDFVPERLELKLEAGTPSLTPQETGKVKLSGRYLYGPPATGLAIEGEIVVKASQQGRAGLCRLPLRPGRRADQPGSQAAGAAARHRRRGQGRDRRAVAGADRAPTGRWRPTSS